MTAGKIKTIYIPSEYDEAWRVFEEIAHRDKGPRGVSVLLNEIVERYAKAHGRGNAGFKIEDFSDSKSIALPTAWEDPTPDKLHGISVEEAKFMVGQMSKWYPELQRKAKTG